MDEELQKRNTDCVYFLASPLTCKKGIECEYRHNEIARLNPRDCWYWLTGNCLNPTCTFRHPPLENHDQAPSQSSVPANKANVPCFFYFNAFCNKGDTCSFLHRPHANAYAPTTAAGKSVDASPIMTDDKLLSNNNITLPGNHALSAPTEAILAPIETPPNPVLDLKLQSKVDVHQQLLETRTQPLITSQVEKAAALEPDSLLPAEGFVQTTSHLCTDQTSEELADDCFRREERWESSPGFDVLVDDESKNPTYKDDGDYLAALEREHRDLNSHFLKYDCEDAVDCPDAELSYEGKMQDSFDCENNVHSVDHVGNNYGRSRGRMLDSLFSQKRKFLPMKVSINDQVGVDLRDHLRKHRITDGHPFIKSSRRHASSHLLGQSLQRPQRRRINQQLRGRLASRVERNGTEPLRDIGALASRAGLLRHSHSNRSRQCYRKHMQFLSSEVPGKVVMRKKGGNQTASSFTGPKTLAQIKEEKKKAEESTDCYREPGRSCRTASADFEGPKPLSEILKERRA